ncbi:hypothetical protein ACFIQF_01840 [Comamonas sp. J-3]|jgi:hypothetical protein|uniref:hypothetical protein n=1 Tax=Comamonas trifloxystrobinivorans TaxID=3350256 RepID=UPI0037298F61
MSSINGIGTRYIGHAEQRRDGSFITTKWLCIGFPLVPLGSYRIFPESRSSHALGMYTRSTFSATPDGLYLPHLFQVYRWYAAFALVLFVAERFSRA